MAELFMECEEEELEPWQQKSKPITVDDDDDDEPIFVGEILSSKPSNTYILNRVQASSPRVAIQNGTPTRGFQPMGRPASSTLAVQPQPRAGSLLGTPGLQKPLPGSSSLQETAKLSAGISQPVSRSTPTPSISGNMTIPAGAQSAARPVATVTAQPAALSLAPPTNASGLGFGLRQSSSGPHCPSGAAVTATGLAKRPAPAEVSGVSPKKAKADEGGSGSSSPVLAPLKSPHEVPSGLHKGVTSSSTKNGAPFPQACPKCNIHFNLLDPLKNHMKYCCPELVHTFLGASTPESSGTSAKVAEAEKGKLIMLVNDFYYGKYEGNVQQVHQEQKTYTTFKCASCMKLLKNNIRFMNHMKHHLELEKQNSESWESHTTCQHCYRQFPTPFQLQCHIESTHTPHESSTICKICELSFETEQILLQHMKDNHKPGEMPYVCQVCSYRSSAFSDVEKHFRAIHENTKNLLCPFCLKVIKIGAPFMHHYMKHQKKGVQRCNKCRLQFLTSKEKLDHKSQHHRTFRKPPQLEGLPPGTKVTIRASAGALPPWTPAPPPAVGPSTSAQQLSPHAKFTNTKNYTKLNASKAKPKPLSVQQKQGPWVSGGSSTTSSSGSSKKNNKIANTALNRLRCPEIQKCIECSSDIRTFASHFPAYVRCSLCRYGTSCSKAYVNHMMSFHSARQQSKRFWIYKAHSEELRGITTVCLNCDLVTDDSGLDRMATHLNECQSHRCQVIVENGPLERVATGGLSERTEAASLSNEGEDKSQTFSRPDPPEGQEGMAPAASIGMENSVERTDQARVDPGDETSPAEEEASCQSPGGPSTTPADQEEEEEASRLSPGGPSTASAYKEEEEAFHLSPGGPSTVPADQKKEEASHLSPSSPSMAPADHEEEEKAPCPSPGGPSTALADQEEEASDPSPDGPSMAPADHKEKEASHPSPGSPSMAPAVHEEEEASHPSPGGPSTAPADQEEEEAPHPSPGGPSTAPADHKEEEEASCASPGSPSTAPTAQEEEETSHLSPGGSSTAPVDQEEEEASHPSLDGPSSLALSAPTKDPSEEGSEGHLEGLKTDDSTALGSEEAASPSTCGPGGQTTSGDPPESLEMGQTGSPLAEGAVAAEIGEGASPSVPEPSSACSEAPREDPTEEEGSLQSQPAEGAGEAGGGEEAPPATLENAASPGSAAPSKDRLQVSAGESNAGHPEDQEGPGSSTVDEGQGNTPVAEGSPGQALSTCSEVLEAPAEGMESRGHDGTGEEGSAVAPGGGDVLPSVEELPSSPGLSACSGGPTEPEEAAPGDQSESREAQETAAAAEGPERLSVPLAVGGSPEAGLQTPWKAVALGSPGKLQVDSEEGRSSAPAAGDDGSTPGAQHSSVEPSQDHGPGGDASGTGGRTGERIPRTPSGDLVTSSQELPQPGSDAEEAGPQEAGAEPSGQAPNGDVIFEQFLRRRDEPESASSDVSEQGSVHLEPLTPSEELEHEAVEILQKGGPVASSSQTEPAEAGASPEGSPTREEAAAMASPAEESASPTSGRSSSPTDTACKS